MKDARSLTSLTAALADRYRIERELAGWRPVYLGARFWVRQDAV
jgi:hypothetical protein